MYLITPIESVFFEVKMELQQLQRNNTTNTDIMEKTGVENRKAGVVHLVHIPKNKL